MRLPSASVVASWPAPNYVNPEVRGPTNTILLTILQVVVTALLAVRFYTRRVLSTGLRLDDWLILAAYVPTTGFAAAGIYHEVGLKLDRHIWDFPFVNATAGYKLSLATAILFAVATTLTKLSMLALIHRVVSAGDCALTRRLCLVVIWAVGLDGLIFVVVSLVQCRPLSAYWTISLRPQDCDDETAHLLAAGVINTVTDFVIVLLPFRTVMGLELPKRQMVVVQGLLMGGILATVAGAVRTYYTWEMMTAPDRDVTWRSHLVISLSALELYVGLTCASLPATKPFFAHFIPKLLGSAGVTGLTKSLNSIHKHRGLDKGDEEKLTSLAPPSSGSYRPFFSSSFTATTTTTTTTTSAAASVANRKAMKGNSFGGSSYSGYSSNYSAPRSPAAAHTRTKSGGGGGGSVIGGMMMGGDGNKATGTGLDNTTRPRVEVGEPLSPLSSSFSSSHPWSTVSDMTAVDSVRMWPGPAVNGSAQEDAALPPSPPPPPPPPKEKTRYAALDRYGRLAPSQLVGQRGGRSLTMAAPGPHTPRRGNGGGGVYHLRAYEDGHISVHQAPGDVEQGHGGI